MNETTDPIIDVIHPHYLNREWHLDRQIVVYKLFACTRDAIDAWIECARETLDAWEDEKPYLAMHDISHPDVTLTPYARKRTREEVARLPERKNWRSATVTRRDVTGTVMKMYVMVEFYRTHPVLERQIFFNREDAFKWLTELL